MTWSALSFRGRIICYEIVGGVVEARELGSHAHFDVTPDLRQAIDEELRRQDAKRLEA